MTPHMKPVQFLKTESVERVWTDSSCWIINTLCILAEYWLQLCTLLMESLHEVVIILNVFAIDSPPLCLSLPVSLCVSVQLPVMREGSVFKDSTQ
jgi:hypothetical protein